ncbi:MAG TPA: oligopeptide transporter, OPT family [Candidatus Polarisedimenticolaceae bacterium]|nr:oligopeptide transporter, OPT family [Candidatus Polarisedimenticolaceae bacterium]
MAEPAQQEHKPFVPQHVEMREFTVGTVVLGLVMTVVLGAANAYLGLKAGQTIAATYPAAVISMAWLRLRRGTILQENLARTAGSIGESVAAGAIFTIPAFLIAGAWPSFEGPGAYWRSTVLMIIGSVLGVLFVSLVRRAMVEDRTLPFPESTAAAEIHKAGQRGAGAAKYLFQNMALGGAIYLAGALNLFAVAWTKVVRFGQVGGHVRLGTGANANALSTGGATQIVTPDVSPAYIGVGYILGPSVAALNFAGSLFAWGFMVPVLIYFLGPQLQTYLPPGAPVDSWAGMTRSVWQFIVRPIAVGGMLVGAGFTMFRMREKIGQGLARAVRELKAGDVAAKAVRTERYMASKTVFLLIGITFIAMAGLYVSFAGVKAGLTAAIVMLIAGFFFCVVSGYLVGMIGSTNNPISGITLSTLIVAALLMVALGVSGQSGVVAVLGVAAVVCVAAAVAGELLQDFKVGYLLGGTPRTIQLVELVAVVVAALVMYFPLLILYKANIANGGIGFGDPALSAPQASLMAFLAKGIVGGDMAWPLIIVGIFLGLTMVLLQVRSPMLVAVGMYLPFGTTSAIFVGGMIRWLADTIAKRRGYNDAQLARFGNVGVLIASGLIAGEALMGLVTSGLAIRDVNLGALLQGTEESPNYFNDPSYLVGVAVVAFIAWLLVKIPLNNAGDPNEPAPPAAMM